VLLPSPKTWPPPSVRSAAESGDWETGVFPQFPLVRRLSKPHRWHNHGNVAMADWLENVRLALEVGQPIDLSPDRTPGCVTWKWLPDQNGPRQNVIVGACQSGMALEGNLVVIGDPMNLNSRALIAKKLAKQGFSNIEPIECQTIYAAAAKLKDNGGAKRLKATLDFVGNCMSGIERAAFEQAITARKAGRKMGATKFGISSMPASLYTMALVMKLVWRSSKVLVPGQRRTCSVAKCSRRCDQP
jgi:hypothetical protein